MGNAVLKLFKGGHDDTPYRPSISSRPQFVSPATAGFHRLRIHLVHFEAFSLIPEELSQQVSISKEAQAKWYAKILAAWNESPPRTPEEAASLVVHALQVQRDALTAFLEFYSLPIPKIQTKVSDPSSWPEGVNFKGGHDDTPYRPRISSRPQIESPTTAGFHKLGIDLVFFETFSLIPEELSQHVTISKKAQAKWYAKILAAWNESPPRTPEVAANLVVHALQVQRDALTAFLEFYSLPVPKIQTQVSDRSSWLEGVNFELHTLPVEADLVGDGDGMTVYVSTADPRESCLVPLEVHEAVIGRREALAVGDYTRANALLKIINEKEYSVFTGDILARKYRIRLRGIDAPELNQEYGKEARDALTKLIKEKPLKILVYCKDPFDRLVGDVYCGGIFIQEKLLRKGCAWHYEAFDKRPVFAQWQKEARNAGRGLWANPNPTEPWVFKRRDRKKVQKRSRNRRNAQRDQRVPIHAY